ncbi:MAG TPA: substrate-binding domain-containing protein [Lachnospiraceae bacterium]|nr:substrate-binding domain-containing protein [Lachnospiraceae bacterium]
MRVRNNRVWIGIVIANVLLICAGLHFFFSDRDYSALQIEHSEKIGACYADLSNSFFDVLNNEISSVVEEHGDILITRDSMLSQEKQNEQIRQLIADGVKALIIAPVDWKEITPALEEAKTSDVIVIIVDAQVYDTGLVDCTVTSDNYDVGIQMSNFLMSQKPSAKILLLEQEGSSSSSDRAAGFKEGIRKFGAYRITAEEQCSGTVESAMQTVNNCIMQGEEFDCVFSVNDYIAVGAITACEKNGIVEEVSFLSTDGSPEGKKLIDSQKMMATAAQFPGEMGGKAVDALYKIINGVECEKNIKVPVKLITRYTINSYDLEKWQ